jgi:hypothetical protein
MEDIFNMMTEMVNAEDEASGLRLASKPLFGHVRRRPLIITLVNDRVPTPDASEDEGELQLDEITDFEREFGMVPTFSTPPPPLEAPTSSQTVRPKVKPPSIVQPQTPKRTHEQVETDSTRSMPVVEPKRLRSVVVVPKTGNRGTAFFPQDERLRPACLQAGFFLRIFT